MSSTSTNHQPDRVPITPENPPLRQDSAAPPLTLDEEKDIAYEKTISITVTESPADGSHEHAPSTPSASDAMSDTDDGWVDHSALERDRHYRPSNAGGASPTPHENMFDRYGFPCGDDVGETEPQMRLRVRKEEQRTEKWRAMMFPGRDGAMHILSEGVDGARRQLEQWNRVKNHRKLKSRIRKGIPQSMRGVVWINLCGAREKMIQYQNKYTELLFSGKRYHDELQIWKDIWRTYRKHAQFGAVEGQNSMQDMISSPSQMQQALFNVLQTYAVHNPAVGYCQGMGSVAALMLMHAGEEEAFWVLDCLCTEERYGMQNIWQGAMLLVPLRFFQFERLFRRALPRLEAHFSNCGLEACSMYGATQWFVTVFLATRLPFATMLRIWDIYLNEGYKTIFRVAIGTLKYFEKELMGSGMEDILTLMSEGLRGVDTEDFIKAVCNVKITRAELQGFEQHYFSQGLGPRP